LCYYFYIDHDFIDTYDLDIVVGRNFREEEYLPPPDKRTDPVPVLVNEKTIESLGFRSADEVVNQLIYFGLGASDWVGEIIGIVENHHQRSLKDDYDPIIFFSIPGAWGQYFTINLSMQQPSESIAFIEDQYEEAFPKNQFDYFFLDDYFDRQYAADQQFGKVFGLFSTLALVVACLGLFGLSTFMIAQRTKEIAVRKVLGATISGMVMLFSKDFVKLILIANLVTLPLVYLGVRHWLNNFAFHTDIGWIMFVVPAALLLIISLTTVSFQTIKTGSVNPVKSLRQE
jgi:putative ABC transport system permease protein